MMMIGIDDGEDVLLSLAVPLWMDSLAIADVECIHVTSH